MVESGSETRKFKDRRKGPDFWKKSIPWMLVVCWFLIWVAWTFIYEAMPQHKTVVDLHYDFNPRTYWAKDMIDKAFIAVNVLFMASVFGLIVNFFRHRRATDKISVTLIFMLLLSLFGAGMIYYRFFY